MLYNCFIELRRNLQEFHNFKVNIIFANIGFALLFVGLLNITKQDSHIAVILLFTWYCSIHGLNSTAYILEDEICDRTIANTVTSRLGIGFILLIRNTTQLLFDLLKAIVIFGVILIFTDASIRTDIYTVGYVFVSIIIMYLIGVCIGSFALIYKRISAVADVLYYFILFFSGIISDIKIGSFFFPFVFLREALASRVDGRFISINALAILGIQLTVYALLASILLKWNLKRMYAKGRIVHV